VHTTIKCKKFGNIWISDLESELMRSTERKLSDSAFFTVLNGRYTAREVYAFRFRNQCEFELPKDRSLAEITFGFPSPKFDLRVPEFTLTS